MSRAGRGSGPAAKRREVQARLAAAAPQGEGEAPVEVPTEVEAQFQAHRIYSLVKAEIVRGYPPLWPPEAVGMSIAEQWLQNLMRRFQQEAEELLRARAAEAGLVLPS